MELMRFVFCVYVILFHCCQKIFNLTTVDKLIFTWAPRGYIGVEFFFILSGMFFAVSLAKIKSEPGDSKLAGSYLRLLLQKYISVFPYHVVAFVILFAFDAYRHHGVSVSDILNVIPGFFLIQRTGISFNNINGVEWYISAMLVAMAIIMPLAVKYRDLYTKYIAPVSAILIYGWLIHEFQTVSGSSEWTIIGYRSVWRAIAGINLGMFANECVIALKKREFSKKTEVMAVLARYAMWGLTTVFVFCTCNKKYEVYPIFMMFAAIVLTMRFPIQNALFQNRFVIFLGKMSLPLYLNQILAIMLVKAYMPNHSHLEICLAVCAVDFILSVPCLYIGNALKKQIVKKCNLEYRKK